MEVGPVATCALFIDYENVFKSLRGQNINTTHKQLAEIFKQEAQKQGEVVYARAYAPWDIFPEAMSIFDRHDIKPEYVEGGRKDNADLVMSLQIQESLRIGRDADVFILVTGDGDFMHVIRLLQENQKKVIIWGVEGSISGRLAQRVGELVNMQQILAAYGVQPSQPGADAGAARATRAEGAVTRDMATRALILRAESVMLSKGWVQVPFLTLMQQMTHPVFGEDNEQRRLLIVRCLEDGILETKKQPNPKRPGTDTTFILLKKENRTVTHTLQSMNRVVAHFKTIINSMPGAQWVAYSLLDRHLAQDPAMAQGPQGETERRGWIELALIEGMLRMEKKENPKNPDFPTSALYLVESHPMVAQVIPGEDNTPMLRRLVLIVDHYLVRTGYQWMSMGLLRGQLSQYGKQEMERCIRVASESNIIIIRQQPNQFGSRPTTGAYLQVGHEQVIEVLRQRDAVLDALKQIYQGKEILPKSAVEAGLEEALQLVASERDEWLHLLTTHQILTPTPVPEGGEGLAFQVQHPVVARRTSVVT